MIAYKLASPMTVGDIKNQISIDGLEVHSLALTFDQEAPVLSVVFLHRASGWKHTVTHGREQGTDKVTLAGAVALWSQTLKPEFEKILSQVVGAMTEAGDLPELLPL